MPKKKVSNLKKVTNAIKTSIGYILYSIYNTIKTFFAGIIYLTKWGHKSSKNRRAVKRDMKETTIEASTEKKKRKNPREHKFKVVEKLTGSILKFEKNLESNKSTIGIILGARGTGKSALGMKILENVHYLTKRKCVAMGFEKGSLPRWIRVIEEADDIPNESFVLIDEGGVLFSSRNAMTTANKLLSSLLLIARHKDISIVFISQNSSNLELNIIRQADYILLKPSSLMQIDFERSKIKEIYKEVSEQFEKHTHIRGLTYVYSDSFRGFIDNRLPEFWSTKVSKAFSKKIN